MEKSTLSSLTSKEGKGFSDYDVAFCPLFPTSLASLNRLESCEIDWNHRDGKITLRGDPIGYTRKLHGQYVIEQNQFPTVLATTKSVRQSKSRTQTSWANSNLWHRIHRLGSLFITWEADPGG